MDDSLNCSKVVYQIYPRSFKDSNNDGIGDIKGIIQKLDYLENLGIDIIWLSPFYPSPMKDFGYDVSDFCNVDPIFGNLSDFDDLIKLAHQKNIQVVIDYIPNHTSSEHPWFQESRSSKTHPKRDWYIWVDGKEDGSPPTNWLSYFGGSAWEFDDPTNQYYYHAFDKSQPDLNWRNPDVVNAMFEVMNFWLNRGVDGFRADAFAYLFESDVLSDEPPNPFFDPDKDANYRSLRHTLTTNQKETLQMLRTITNFLKEKKCHFLITESPSGEPLNSMLRMYRAGNWKYHMPFNFFFLKNPWNAAIVKRFIDRYDKALGTQFIPNYVLGNHDKPRVASRIGSAQARVAAMLQCSLRGISCIYYGEELGMINTPLRPDQVVDTYEFNSPGKGLGRDPERTPMQWNSSKHAGFTNGEKTWLPVHKNYLTVNVEYEESDPTSFLQLYKRLIQLKKTHPAISQGEYLPLPAPAENVLAFLRQKDTNRVLVLLNFDEQDKQLTLDYEKTSVLCAATMNFVEGQTINLSHFTLKGNEGLILSIP